MQCCILNQFARQLKLTPHFQHGQSHCLEDIFDKSWADAKASLREPGWHNKRCHVNQGGVRLSKEATEALKLLPQRHYPDLVLQVAAHLLPMQLHAAFVLAVGSYIEPRPAENWAHAVLHRMVLDVQAVRDGSYVVMVADAIHPVAAHRTSSSPVWYNHASAAEVHSSMSALPGMIVQPAMAQPLLPLSQHTEGSFPHNGRQVEGHATTEVHCTPQLLCLCKSCGCSHSRCCFAFSKSAQAI